MPVDAVTAPQENREPGGNPGRYRRCMRVGCCAWRKPVIGETWEGRTELMMRKPGELLKWGKNTRVCTYGTCDFLLRKNGRGSHFTVVAAFYVFCTYRKSNWILLYDVARWSGQIPEQPSIAVLGKPLKSESLPYHSGITLWQERSRFLLYL